MQQATQGSNGATPAATPVSSLPKKLPTPPPLVPPNMPGPDDEDDISPNTPRNKIAAFNTKQRGTKAPPKLNEPGNSNYQPIEPAQDLIPQDITTRVKKTANDTFGTGALFLVFSVLAFLIWTLIPTASGYTRMQLLYFTILKKTNLATQLNSQTDQANAANNNPTQTPTTPAPGPFNPLQNQNPVQQQPVNVPPVQNPVQGIGNPTKVPLVTLPASYNDLQYYDVMGF